VLFLAKAVLTTLGRAGAGAVTDGLKRARAGVGAGAGALVGAGAHRRTGGGAGDGGGAGCEDRAFLRDPSSPLA